VTSSRPDGEVSSVAYDRVAPSYHAARGLSLEALEGWRQAVAPYLGSAPALPVVDVGSGTGTFARAFAEWFGVCVVGIEPSAAMRDQAELRSAHPNIVYRAGSAEAIPLPPASASSAWLSTVIHHVADLGAAARELRRTIVAGAPVLIRSAFPGRLDGITLFRFFPGARKVAETFPTIDRVGEAFAATGFRIEHVEDVPQVSAPNLRAFAKALTTARLADSTLVALDQVDFDRGLTAVRAVAREVEAAPVVDRLTLVVLR